MDEKKNKMTGGEKLAYFTFVMLFGFTGIVTSLVLKANDIIVSGDETILIPSGILFLAGLAASMIASLDA
jgi:hypothetical protein